MSLSQQCTVPPNLLLLSWMVGARRSLHTVYKLFLLDSHRAKLG